MRRLIAFEMLTLDGCYATTDGDFGWAHRRERDAEWDAFVAGNAGSGGELVFGRRTYQMMASWWPTPEAAQSEPRVAEAMTHCRSTYAPARCTRPHGATPRCCRATRPPACRN